MDNPHPISIGALVSGLMSDFRCLLRQEMELARHEMQHERHKLSSIMIQSGIGLLLGMMAILFLLTDGGPSTRDLHKPSALGLFRHCGVHLGTWNRRAAL
jgi:hypothetical protein